MVIVVDEAVTVTVTGAELSDEQPLLLTAFTVYVPAVVTVIDCVVAPVLHKYDDDAEAVNTTEPPAQIAVGPEAVITGAAGFGNVVTVNHPDQFDQHPSFATLTLKVPDEDTILRSSVFPSFHSNCSPYPLA
jgi:hypothetical protein